MAEQRRAPANSTHHKFAKGLTPRALLKSSTMNLEDLMLPHMTVLKDSGMDRKATDSGHHKQQMVAQ